MEGSYLVWKTQLTKNNRGQKNEEKNENNWFVGRCCIVTCCVFKKESSGKGNTDSNTKLKGTFVAMC